MPRSPSFGTEKGKAGAQACNCASSMPADGNCRQEVPARVAIVVKWLLIEPTFWLDFRPTPPGGDSEMPLGT